MPEQEFATKQDIRELKRELNERMDQMQASLIEAMHVLQTEILRGFNNWVSPFEIKMRGHEERITVMEERPRQIERALIEKNPPNVQ